MAGSHPSNVIDFTSRTGFADVRPARPAPNSQGRKMATRIAIATGLCLAAAPLATMALLPGAPAQAIERESPRQAIALDAAIMAFTQDGATINVSLMASDDGQRVYVEDAANNIIEIPVSPGQTHVSAQLPASFVTSGALTIRVG
jgi:hypothetical protein